MKWHLQDKCVPCMLHVIIIINTGVVCAARKRKSQRPLNHQCNRSPTATIRIRCMIVYIINQPGARSARRPLSWENYLTLQHKLGLAGSSSGIFWYIPWRQLSPLTIKDYFRRRLNDLKCARKRLFRLFWHQHLILSSQKLFTE